MLRKEVISENVVGVKVGKKAIQKDIRDCPWPQRPQKGKGWGMTSAQEKRINRDSDSLRMEWAPLPIPPRFRESGAMSSVPGKSGDLGKRAENSDCRSQISSEARAQKLPSVSQ